MRNDNDCKETIKILVEDSFRYLSPYSIKEIQDTPKDRLIVFHHTLGRHLRNVLNLWEKPYSEWMHPDDLSIIILEEIWKKGQPNG